ncbi:MAG: type IX secretion system membrane protein PorP/SprF [Bacteroidota bacterium]|nr:type IX secretion system membrane protein PorP/SprF [Bacteroidota bacterium]MEC8401150.1 type IX secretion system membrane protein PorP/SprF [Bacteroidota bacterium]
MHTAIRTLIARSMASAMLVGVCVLGTTASAQDQQFTQFNAAPTSFNPAYAGVSGKARLASLYRSQWTALPQAFTGFHLAYDRPTLDKRMGFGFLLSNEQAGAGALSRMQLMAQAAHNLRLNRRMNLRMGMQLGFGARSIDMGGLVFMDQILRDNAATSIEQGIGGGRQYVDMGAGFLLLSRRVWFGASANHLTSPNISLNPDYPEQLAMLMSAHGGARIQLVRGPRGRFRRDLIVSWKYMHQGQRNQLDVGAYYDLSMFTLGVWYRGVPVQKAVDGSLDVDALSFVFGFGNRDFKMGYSYDITLNRLGALGPAGTHEFSVKYFWDVSRRRDPRPPYHPCVDY